MPHAFNPDPEEPDESEVWQYVTEVFRNDGSVVLSDYLPRVAFPHVQHLQWDTGGLCHCFSCCCELPYPLYVLPSVQANILALANLKYSIQHVKVIDDGGLGF